MSDQETTPLGEAAASVTQEERPVRRRRKGPGDFYVVITDEGIAMVKSADLATSLSKMPGADVYELGRKVKKLMLTPGVQDLLTGKQGESKLEVEYE